MADIVNLAAERDRRNAPGADCTRINADDRPIFEFLIEFKMDGKVFGESIWAYDLGDAERILVEYRDSLRVLGPAVARV